MNKKVVLIGAGELGSRHLQSLAKCDFAVEIQVVDPSEAALATAKKRFAEMPANHFVEKIEFLSTLDTVWPQIDLAVIATNSDVRLEVLTTLLSKAVVQTLILEKVLFQSIRELDQAQDLLRKHAVRTYVNCPKRGYRSSEIIREKIAGSSKIDYIVMGENWGLGCNAIHFIDLMSFYSGEITYKLDTAKLSRIITASKRKGFFEFYGELSVEFSPGKTLKMISEPGEKFSCHTRIETNSYGFSFDESKGTLALVDKSNRTEEVIGYGRVFQSELTHRVARDILFGESVKLPDFETSARLHRPLLDGLLTFYNEVRNESSSFLPIT